MHTRTLTSLTAYDNCCNIYCMAGSLPCVPEKRTTTGGGPTRFSSSSATSCRLKFSSFGSGASQAFRGDGAHAGNRENDDPHFEFAVTGSPFFPNLAFDPRRNACVSISESSSASCILPAA